MSQRWTVEVSDTPELSGMREKGLDITDLRRGLRDVADRCIQHHRRIVHRQARSLPWTAGVSTYVTLAFDRLPLRVITQEKDITHTWIYDYHDHHPEPGTARWNPDTASIEWTPHTNKEWYVKAYVPGVANPILPAWVVVD